MGWQVHPDLTKDQMVELLWESAHVQPSGANIIDPAAFIQLVQTKVQRGGSFLAEGGQFSLFAATLGSGYQWQKDGQPLEDDGRITGAATRSLLITSLRQEDAGVYACMYNDGVNPIQTETYVLELLPPGSLPAVSKTLLVALAALLSTLASIKLSRTSRRQRQT